jgi:hypothetical protein
MPRITKRRRCLFIRLAFVIALLPNRTPGTSAAQLATLSVGDVVGCYELRSISWEPNVATLPEPDRRLFTPSRFFELTATLQSESGSKYRRILSRFPQEPQRLAHGGWMLTSDQELTAMFPNNGFEWLLLIVSVREGQRRFSGQAVALTDAGARPNKGTVAFDRVACWEN